MSINDYNQQNTQDCVSFIVVKYHARHHFADSPAAEPVPAAAAPAAAPSAVELEKVQSLPLAGKVAPKATDEVVPEAAASAGNGLLLFTTSTCPKCVMAKKFLADAGISYDTVVVDKDPALAKQYGVRQAPTLLVLKDGAEVRRVENPSNIRLFAEQNRA